jgi:hypothetical protein
VSDVSYKLEPRGRSATAIVRVAPDGSERVLLQYKDAGVAANVRLTLAIAAGSEVASK